MQPEAFYKTLQQENPPAGISIYLQALWYDAKDQWSKAHALVDSLHDTKACHVHAYLHRKEGDLGNAAYWYNRAGRPMPSSALQQEWEQLVQLLL